MILLLLLSARLPVTIAVGANLNEPNMMESSGDPAKPIPLVVTNNCADTIWPGLGTQHGIGPGTGGFKLGPNDARKMWVSSDWQGRVWGRTNCTFNEDGTGPGNLNGVDGNGAACMTGDCFGRLDCLFTVRTVFLPKAPYSTPGERNEA